MEGGDKIDSPQTFRRKKINAFKKRHYVKFVFTKRPHEPVDNVVEAIKKKKHDAEKLYQDLLLTLKEARESNLGVMQAALEWLEQKVIDQCDDPNKITFSVHVFSMQDAPNFFVARHLHAIKEQAVDALKKRGMNDKISEYLSKYEVRVLRVMMMIVTKWNEKHPTLCAEVITPDRYDKQYFIARKK